MIDTDHHKAEVGARWRTESAYLARYAGSGVLNTVAGFSVIFALMGFGAPPLIANIGGYAVGFVLGFVVSKSFVFRSNGKFVDESLRYLIAFCICFTLNLLTLSVVLSVSNIGAVLAQIMAASVYTGSMYLLTRWYVFRDHQQRKAAYQ